MTDLEFRPQCVEEQTGGDKVELRKCILKAYCEGKNNDQGTSRDTCKDVEWILTQKEIQACRCIEGIKLLQEGV